MTIAMQLYSGTPIIQNKGKSEGLPKATHTIEIVGVYVQTIVVRSLTTGELLEINRDVIDTTTPPIDLGLFEQSTINDDTAQLFINL